MTPSTRVEKSRGRAVEKETKTPRLHDSRTPPLLEDRAVTIQDVAARSGVLHLDCLARRHRCGRRRTGDRGAGARGDRRPRLPAEPAGALVPSTRDAHDRFAVPDNSNPFFAELARTIEDAGFADGYSVVLCNSDLSAVSQETSIDVLLANRVDGLHPGVIGIDPRLVATMPWHGFSTPGRRAWWSTGIWARHRSIRCWSTPTRAAIWPGNL